MRKFKFSVQCNDEDVSEGIIEIDQSIIDIALDPSWKNVFYDLVDAEGVASHVAWILCYHKERLSTFEGFLGIDDSLVKIIENPYFDWEYTAEEIL